MVIRADTATSQYETGARSPAALTHSRAPGSEPASAGSPERGSATAPAESCRRACA